MATANPAKVVVRDVAKAVVRAPTVVVKAATAVATAVAVAAIASRPEASRVNAWMPKDVQRREPMSACKTLAPLAKAAAPSNARSVVNVVSAATVVNAATAALVVAASRAATLAKPVQKAAPMP
jgi:hypothetical protein